MRIDNLCGGRGVDRVRRCRIYGLYVEGENVPFYIGSTCAPLCKRLNGHLRTPSSRVREVLDKVGRDNVYIEELCEVDEEDRYRVEGLALRLADRYGIELANRANIL